MKTFKRLLAVVLVFSLVVCYAAPSVFAADEVEVEIYYNKCEVSSDVVAKVGSVGDYVTPTGNHYTYVGDDGYYYLDSGELLVVSLDGVNPNVGVNLSSLSDLVNAPNGFYYVEADPETFETTKKVDLMPALKEYLAVSSTYYPLNADLLYIIKDAGNSNGWYFMTSVQGYVDAYLAFCRTATLVGEEEVTDCEHTNIEDVAAVEATDHGYGHAEYWYCPDCDSYFSDSESNYPVAVKSMTILPLHYESLDYVEEVPATCGTDGVAGHWYCSECSKCFLEYGVDEEVSEDDLVIESTGHAMEHHEAAAATNHVNGTYEYWYCPVCDMYFTDAEGNGVTNSKAIKDPTQPPLHYDSLTYVEEVPATCTESGNLGYWYCSECDAYFAEGNTEETVAYEDLIIPAHTVDHLEASEATCSAPALMEHWYCTVDDTYYLDAACTLPVTYKDLITAPALGHQAEYHEATAASEHVNGMSEYWYCPVCDCYFAEEACEYPVAYRSLVTELRTHDDSMVYMSAWPATCTMDGTVEYWYCSECMKCFLEPQTEESVSYDDVVVPATGHNWEYIEASEASCDSPALKEHYHCTLCDVLGVEVEGEIYEASYDELITAEALGHNMTHYEATEATEHVHGMAEYWYCDVCDDYFRDENGEQPIGFKNLVTEIALHYDSLIYTEEVIGTCTVVGIAENWYCPICDKYFTSLNTEESVDYDSLITPAHSVEHFDAVTEPTCTSPATVEYWHCTECDTYYTDEACTIPVAYKSLITEPALGHSAEYHEATSATTHVNGMSEYWYCPVCDDYFADEACEYPVASKSLVTEIAEHYDDLIYTEEVIGTCTVEGVAEHWYCPICDVYFAELGTEETVEYDSLITPAHVVEHIDAVTEPTCDKPATVEYWHCTECDTYYLDAECTIPVTYKDLITAPALGHTMVKTEAVEPTCTSNGNLEYWYCSVCDTYFSDEEGNYPVAVKSMTVPATGHSLVKTEAVAPTCTANGNLEYWYCAVCDVYFSDEEGKYPVAVKSMTVPATGHTLTHYDAVAATETKTGNKEYWYCADCGTYFTDAEGTNAVEYSSLVIAATGTSSTTPDTGDSSMTLVWTVLVIASCVGVATVAVIGKKKRA